MGSENFIAHPNLFHEHPARDYFKPDILPPFEVFLPFIDQSIPNHILTPLIELLRIVHAQTGTYWKASRCYYSRLVTSTMNEVLPDYIRGSQAEVFKSGLHDWTVLKAPENPAIIIDPVGLSVKMSTMSNFPYFGFLSNYPFKKTGELTYAVGQPLI